MKLSFSKDFPQAMIVSEDQESDDYFDAFPMHVASGASSDDLDTRRGWPVIIHRDDLPGLNNWDNGFIKTSVYHGYSGAMERAAKKHRSRANALHATHMGWSMLDETPSRYIEYDEFVFMKIGQFLPLLSDLTSLILQYVGPVKELSVACGTRLLSALERCYASRDGCSVVEDLSHAVIAGGPRNFRVGCYRKDPRQIGGRNTIFDATITHSDQLGAAVKLMDKASSHLGVVALLSWVELPQLDFSYSIIPWPYLFQSGIGAGISLHRFFSFLARVEAAFPILHIIMLYAEVPVIPRATVKSWMRRPGYGFSLPYCYTCTANHSMYFASDICSTSPLDPFSSSQTGHVIYADESYDSDSFPVD